MANEADLVEFDDWPSDFTVANATAITKGAICMMTDPRTAAIATNGPVAVAGIAARDKIASDGRTNLGMWHNGKFRVSLSGACKIGDPLMVSALATTYPNYVEAAGVTTSGAFTIGFAEETGVNGDRIQIRLQPGTSGGAVT